MKEKSLKGSRLAGGNPTRKRIDYDYYAYLLSLTEVIPVDYGTRKGLSMEEFFFLGYKYMRSIYDSILQ